MLTKAVAGLVVVLGLSAGGTAYWFHLQECVNTAPGCHGATEESSPCCTSEPATACDSCSEEATGCPLCAEPSKSSEAKCPLCEGEAAAPSRAAKLQERTDEKTPAAKEPSSEK